MSLEKLTDKQSGALVNLQSCYQQLQQKNSNVVIELLPQGPQTVVYDWDHYPDADEVCDTVNHTQYYYHSHPSHDPIRLIEHGHFHVFLRGCIFPETMQPLHISEKHKLDPTKDNLSHLIAIAMSDQGYPVALFTLNHWVTQGLWYAAKDMISALDSFLLTENRYPITNQWVTSLIHLLQPQIEALLKPLSTADGTIFPCLNSSLIRSKINTLESTAIPIKRIKPAIPGNVKVALNRAKPATNKIKFKIKAIIAFSPESL